MTAVSMTTAPRESWAAQIVRSRWASLGALAVVIAALALPPQGFGLPLCQFRTMTQMPCLGCGLTRSFIGMAHLNFAAAFFYHPLGALVFPIVVFLAGLLPASNVQRDRIALWVNSRGSLLVRLGIVYAALFVTYGFGRMVWVWLSGTPSPW